MLDSRFLFDYGAIANHELLHAPAYYDFKWILIGILFLLVAGGIVWLVFYVTRKKHIKTIADLAPQAPKQVDIDALRKKYLEMVDLVDQKYGERKIKASLAHQNLSLIVRYFYAEAGGFHAEVLTLSDLKKSKRQKLADVIEKYYPDEFNMLENGMVKTAVSIARELINDDEVLLRQRTAMELGKKRHQTGEVENAK